MNKPPREIDGATVLEWAWSGHKPFGVVPVSLGGVAIEIFGLAICRYPGESNAYRFSCDRDWQSEQDAHYDTVTEAKANLPDQYKSVDVNWIAMD